MGLPVTNPIVLSRASLTPAPGVPLRDPKSAVRFVNQFNDQLKLSTADRKEKDQLSVNSPAKFLRVNPALFFQDMKGPYAHASHLLGPSPSGGSRPSPIITIAGDAHLGNFGTIRAADGQTMWGCHACSSCGCSLVMWGLNDYDMAGQGSVENEIERTATSIALMARAGSDSNQLIADFTHGYLAEMSRLSTAPTPQNSGLTAGEAQGPVADLIADRSEKTQKHLLKKLATQGPDGYQLQRTDELLNPTPQDHQLVQSMLTGYDQTQGATPSLERPIKILDLARRVDSGGSTFGLNRYYALVQGTGSLPLIMEIKQELPSAPETASADPRQCSAKNLLAGMQALGGTPNPIEATATAIDGTPYFIREREPEKGSVDLSKLSPTKAASLVTQAGTALARAHAHEPGAAAAVTRWVGSDESTLTTNLESFAQTYAQQTRNDTQAFAATLPP